MGVIQKKDNPTKVYAFEKSGQRRLIILGLVSGEFVEIDTFENFHKDIHGMSQVYGGSLHAVEATGTLRILKLF